MVYSTKNKNSIRKNTFVKELPTKIIKEVPVEVIREIPFKVEVPKIQYVNREIFIDRDSYETETQLTLLKNEKETLIEEIKNLRNVGQQNKQQIEKLNNKIKKLNNRPCEIIEVEKIVEVPKIQYVDREVFKEVEKIVEVPVEKIVEIEKKVFINQENNEIIKNEEKEGLNQEKEQELEEENQLINIIEKEINEKIEKENNNIKENEKIIEESKNIFKRIKRLNIDELNQLKSILQKLKEENIYKYISVISYILEKDILNTNYDHILYQYKENFTVEIKANLLTFIWLMKSEKEGSLNKNKKLIKISINILEIIKKLIPNQLENINDFIFHLMNNKAFTDNIFEYYKILDTIIFELDTGIEGIERIEEIINKYCNIILFILEASKDPTLVDKLNKIDSIIYSLNNNETLKSDIKAYSDLVKFIFNENKNPELTVDKLNKIDSIICKLNNNETLKSDIKAYSDLVKFIFNENKNPELTVDKLNKINSIIYSLNNNETLKSDIKAYSDLVKFIFNENKNPELTVDKLNEINSIICKLNNNETLKKDIKAYSDLVKSIFNENKNPS